MALESNKYYQAALEYIKTADLGALENGKHIIDSYDNRRNGYRKRTGCTCNT